MSYKRVVTTVLLAIAASAQTASSGASVSVRHFVAPAYPAAAWLAGIQGTTVADVTIKADGSVDSVKIISALPIFRGSLETALRQWLFQTSEAGALRITTRFEFEDCPLSDSGEPGKLYYIRTTVTADLPSFVAVKTCPHVIETVVN